MIGKFLAGLDRRLRTQAIGESDHVVAPLIDAMRLEDRVLYSAVPLVDPAELQVADSTESEVTEVLPAVGHALDQGDTEMRASEFEVTFDLDLLADGPLDPAQRSEVVFIDAGVEDLDTLLADLFSADQRQRDIDVVLLDADQDGIQQISSYLDRRSGIDAVHIISHGDGLGIQLGDVRLDSNSASGYAGQIASWADAMDVDADLLIYGCNLASTSTGQDLLASIAALCGCDVAASDDITGASELEGDWELEYQTGTIDTAIAISAAAQAQWQHSLELADPGVPTLWLSIKDDENISGFGGLLGVDDSEVLELADPGLRYGTTSDGSVNVRLNFDTFGGSDVNLTGMHVVSTSQTLGGTVFAPINVKTGDVLFSIDRSEILTSQNSISVDKHDIVLFSPTTAGDYSSGTFTMVLDDLTSDTIRGLTLVEKDTLIGDYTASAGDFLFVTSGSDRQIKLFETEGVGGGGQTTGTTRVLLDTNDANVSVGKGLFGIELIETATQVGGFDLSAGQILLTTDADTDVGQNALAVDRQDIFVLTVTQTTLIAGSDNGVATAAMFFDGSDMNLDSSPESIDAIAFFKYSIAPTDIAPDSVSVDENIDSSGGLTVATLTSTDPNPGDSASYSIVGGADQANFSIGGSDQLILTAGTLDFETQSSYSVQVRVTDSDGLTYDELLTVNVNDINEAPTATATTLNPDFVENGSAVSLFESASINLIDAGDRVESLLFQVSGLQNGNQELLNLDGDNLQLVEGYSVTTSTNGFDVFVSLVGDVASVSVTKAGGLTAAEAATLVNGLGYENRSEDPQGGSRIVTLTTVKDDGGRASGGDDDADVNLASTVSLTAINDAPMVTTIEAAAIDFRENDPATQITGTLSLSDWDDSQIESAEIQIAVGYASDQDRLTFVDSGSIVGVWDVATGTLRLSGSDTVANYELAIRSIRYENSSEDPSEATRTLQIRVNDGQDDSNLATRSLTVTAINDDVQIATNLADTVLEGSTANVLSAAFLQSTDLDNTAAEVRYVIVRQAEYGTLFRDGVALSDTDSFSQADIDGGLITYDHDGSEFASDSFTFTVEDGDGSQTTGTFQWNIDLVSDNGITAITDDDAADNEVTEGVVIGTAVGITAAADDADAGETVSYSLDDSDGGRFAIDTTSGIVRVASQIDRETDGPLRSITVRATSDDGSFSTRDFQIEVIDADEFDVSPVWDSDVADDAIYENVATGSLVGVTASAGDADATNATVTYTLDDDAGGRFTIDVATGVITVADSSLLDFETAASHQVTVRASSQDSSFQTQSITIEVLNVNETPVLAGLGGQTLLVSNQGTPVSIAGAAELHDIDAPVNYSGAVLTITSNGFASLDNLNIDTDGAISLSAGISDGSQVEVNGLTVATLSGASASGFTVTFNGNAVAADVEAILQAMQFSTTSEAFGNRSVQFTFDDGDGNANGGQSTSSTTTVDLSVMSSDTPLITVQEDIAYQFQVSDFDTTRFPFDSEATLQITGLPAAGVLTFAGNPVAIGQWITQVDLNAGLLEYVSDPNGNGELYAAFEFSVSGRMGTIAVLAGEPNSLTLNGGAMTPTDELLADEDNFGRLGLHPTAISVVAASATIDADYLAQGNVLFNGYVPDANWTADELAALDTWIQSGGILISNSDSASYDAVSDYFGLRIGGSGSTIWRIDDATHDIIDGDFGLVGAVGDTIRATGAIAYFDSSSLAVGDQVLAIDSGSGEPTIVVRQHAAGWIVFTSDEGIFRAGMSGGGEIATANDRLVANLFAWTANQLPSTTTHSMQIDVEAVNDAPTNLGGQPSDFVAWEDRPSDVDLTALDLHDIDSPSAELMLTLSTRSGGTLSVVNAVGVTVSGDGSGFVSLTGTADDLNSFLNDPTRLQFTAAANVYGSGADAILIVLDDQGNVGTGGNATLDLGTIGIDVAAVNDAPTLVTNTGATVLEGTLNNPITSGMLQGSDVDDISSGLVYTLTQATTHGTLTLAGVGPLGLNATFTQADIDAGKLSYSHDDSETLEDAFEFSLADGGEDGAAASSGRFVLTIDMLNDHVLSALTDLDADPERVLENAAIGTPVGITALATDGDVTDTVLYSLDDSDGGRFAIDANDGTVRVAGSIDRESDGQRRSILVRATSSDGSYQTQDYEIEIVDVNEFGASAIIDVDSAANAVDENVAAGTRVGITVASQDLDATQNGIRFSLAVDVGGRFEIDSVTGEIRVADGGLLDFELQAFHALTVIATSDDGSTATQVITVLLRDVDEFVGTIISNAPSLIGQVISPDTSVGSQDITLPDDSDSEDDGEEGQTSLAPPVVDVNDEPDSDGARRPTTPETLVSLLDEMSSGTESGERNHGNLAVAHAARTIKFLAQSERLQEVAEDPWASYDTFDYDVNQVLTSLDRFADELSDDEMSLQLVAGTASCLFAGASMGVAVWVLNSSALVGFVSAAVPSWARFDPIYIVRDGVVNKQDDDRSIAEILTQKQQAPAEGTQ